MNNTKAILITSTILCIMVFILGSGYVAAPDNEVLMPISLILLGIVYILNGAMWIKNKKYAFGLFLILAGIFTCGFIGYGVTFR